MQFKDKKKMTVFLLAAIFFIVLDRVFKQWAISNPSETVVLIPELFKLNLAKNYYIAFSIPLSGVLLNIVILAIIVILTYYLFLLWSKKQFLLVGYLTNIQFGAISNIYDRLKYGFVIDYFDLRYFTIFNLADTMIVVASILLSINLLQNNNE